VELRGQDVGGIAVHGAARVMAAAAAGEVIASSVVVELVEGTGISFVDRGVHALRSVPEPRRLWAVAGG
jgi:class 3 adenylate cyclase